LPELPILRTIFNENQQVSNEKSLILFPIYRTEIFSGFPHCADGFSGGIGRRQAR